MKMHYTNLNPPIGAPRIVASVLAAVLWLSTPEIRAENFDYRKISNISYLGEERGEKMDAYLPDESRYPKPYPAVLVIHGGGWAVGDKATSREKDICSTLAKAGYAAFSINYRLTRYQGKVFISPITEQAWPRNFQDCREGIRYVSEHAQDYGVDPNRMGVLGASAGGHLALLTAFAPATLHSSGNQRDVYRQLRCVISMYGIHDLRQFGGECFPPGEDKASVIKEASAVTYFEKSGPPVLIIHGDKDACVKPSVAEDMAKRLGEAGVPHELVWVPGAEHGFDLHPPEMNLEPIVLAFLERYLKRSASPSK